MYLLSILFVKCFMFIKNLAKAIYLYMYPPTIRDYILNGNTFKKNLKKVLEKNNGFEVIQQIFNILTNESIATNELPEYFYIFLNMHQNVS